MTYPPTLCIEDDLRVYPDKEIHTTAVTICPDLVIQLNTDIYYTHHLYIVSPCRASSLYWLQAGESLANWNFESYAAQLPTMAVQTFPSLASAQTQHTQTREIFLEAMQQLTPTDLKHIKAWVHTVYQRR